jgi:hypothetical protein
METLHIALFHQLMHIHLQLLRKVDEGTGLLGAHGSDEGTELVDLEPDAGGGYLQNQQQANGSGRPPVKT